jgi:hypothetical protein
MLLDKFCATTRWLQEHAGVDLDGPGWTHSDAIYPG